jgi:hypothetical protein
LGEVGDGWTGWTGTPPQGPELNGLVSNAADLGEASSFHRYRVRSEPRTLAL